MAGTLKKKLKPKPTQVLTEPPLLVSPQTTPPPLLVSPQTTPPPLFVSPQTTRELLAQGKIEAVIATLRSERPDDDELLFISGQFHDLETRFRKKLIGQADYETAKAKIILTLTNLLKND